jgi:beta-lactam-binding protein with PASTA domain
MLGRGGHRLISRIAVIALAATLSAVVSGSSPADAVVPDVVGLSVTRAYDAVHEAGFAVQIDEPVEMSAFVSHQSRAAGTAGHAATAVVLGLTARGPRGRLPPGGTGRVPRVVAKPLPDAFHTLNSAGFLWSAAPLPPLPATMRQSLFENYRVANQNPKPGTQFTQTLTRVLPGGSVLTETQTVGLSAELRPE